VDGVPYLIPSDHQVRPTAHRGGGALVRANWAKNDRRRQRQKNVSFVGQLDRSNQHVKYLAYSFLCILRFSCDMLPSLQKNLSKKTPQYFVGKGLAGGG